MDIEKYGRLLEKAVLNLHLQKTAGKNVPSERKDRLVDLSEIQAKLRKIDWEARHPLSEWKQMPPSSTRKNRLPAKPRTKATPVPTGPSTETSGWKRLPTPRPRKKNQKSKGKNVQSESLEPSPTPESPVMSDWEQIFDLRSD